MRSELNLPTSASDQRSASRRSPYQFVYSLAGLVLGFGGILGGVVLLMRGVAGSSTWTASVLGVESRVTDAAPGAILFVVGLLVVLATRFDVRLAAGAARQNPMPPK